MRFNAPETWANHLPEGNRGGPGPRTMDSPFGWRFLFALHAPLDSEREFRPSGFGVGAPTFRSVCDWRRFGIQLPIPAGEMWAQRQTGTRNEPPP